MHDISPKDVIREIARAKPFPLLACIVLSTLTFPLRTARWRFLLRRDGAQLPFNPLWHATAIGFMANNLLPARAGELARAFAANKLTGVRFLAAVGSIAVERVMDGMAMVALLLVAIAWGGFAPGTRVGHFSLVEIAMVTGLIFMAMLVLVLAIVHQPEKAQRAVQWLIRRFPPRFQTGVLNAVEGLLSGLESMRDPRRFLTVALWSLIIWCTYAASFWLCFLAFDMQVPWTASFLLQALIGFGVAIPSSPGFFGPFEAVTRATLALYGVNRRLAVSYAVAYHIGTFIPISALGLWSLSRAHLHLADLRQRADESRSDALEPDRTPAA